MQWVLDKMEPKTFASLYPYLRMDFAGATEETLYNDLPIYCTECFFGAIEKAAFTRLHRDV